MATFDPAKTSHSRVFLIEGRARPDHDPVYESCMSAGAVDQSFGELTRIECPDPSAYGQFVEMGTIQGAEERATTDLMGRYAMDLASTMLALAKRRCAFDVQVHMGACKDPSDFNSFDKALVFENARASNWGTNELGTLSSDGDAAVDETTSISAEEIYEILQLSLASRASDILTNEVLDVVRCDTQSCGDCDTESDGCSHFYAITKAAGGSPSTPADIVHTIDGGDNWYADDIDSLGAAEDPSAVGCLGNYIVVVSNTSNSLHYALKAYVDDVDYDETWVENATGFVVGGEPSDCWRSPTGLDLFICGDGGYVYKCEDPTVGVTVLDAGAATTQDLNAIHSIGDNLVVAVGDAGVVIYSTDGASLQTTNANPTWVGNNLNAVWAKSESEWFVGVDDGRLMWTNDQGDNWTTLVDVGAAIYDIAFATDSVGYLASATSTPRGQIRRTFDGGNSWVVLPEGVGTIPANDRINAIAACPHDANIVVGVGLADDGTDGFIVVGED